MRVVRRRDVRAARRDAGRVAATRGSLHRRGPGRRHELRSAEHRVLDEGALVEAVEAASGPAARLDAAIEAGSTGGLAGDESRILYEFWSLGLRDASLNDADHALDRRQVAIYREILDDGVANGVFRPRLAIDDVAWALVALEDGLVMDILAGTKTRDEVTALIRSVAEAMLDVTLRGAASVE